MKEAGVERVAVIGAGLMGFGVAVEFARFGYQVSIYNRSEEKSLQAMEQAREALDLISKAGKLHGNTKAHKPGTDYCYSFNACLFHSSSS